MKASLWRGQHWRGDKKEGWILFHFRDERGKWKCIGADLYDKDRNHLGWWHRENIPLDMLREVEKSVTKTNGKPR